MKSKSFRESSVAIAIEFSLKFIFYQLELYLGVLGFLKMDNYFFLLKNRLRS
jgi:hypothetical protein